MKIYQRLVHEAILAFDFHQVTSREANFVYGCDISLAHLLAPIKMNVLIRGNLML